MEFGKKFKLNEESINKLRDRIAVLLTEEVLEEERVILDKELLERLLFKVVVLNQEKKIKVKLPVWSGAFLKKLDLSSVDFSDVSWQILNIKDEQRLRDILDGDLNGYDVKCDDVAVNEILEIQKLVWGKKLQNNIVKKVNYAETNAKLDLSKSFESKCNNMLVICGCDFTGVDLSSQNLTNITSITVDYSRLGNTNLCINEIPLFAYESSLCGIDLKTKKINGVKYFSFSGIDLGKCDLTGCGVQIDLDLNEFNKSNLYIKSLADIFACKWTGCFVNGKKILSWQEKKEKRDILRILYAQFESTRISEVIDTIKKQKRKFWN